MEISEKNLIKKDSKNKIFQEKKNKLELFSENNNTLKVKIKILFNKFFNFKSQKKMNLFINKLIIIIIIIIIIPKMK